MLLALAAVVSTVKEEELHSLRSLCYRKNLSVFRIIAKEDQHSSSYNSAPICTLILF